MSTDETRAFEPERPEEDTQRFQSAEQRPGDETRSLDREQRLDEVIAAYLRAVQAGEALIRDIQFCR